MLFLQGVALLVLAMPVAVFADPGTFYEDLRPTHHSPNGTGAAIFQNNPIQNLRTLSVTIAHVASANRLVQVLVNGEFIDDMYLDDTGSGQLFLSTEDGDDVPDLGAGDHLTIVDAVHGRRVLLKGKFERDDGDELGR
jgi:hypothetical protein